MHKQLKLPHSASHPAELYCYLPRHTAHSSDYHHIYTLPYSVAHTQTHVYIYTVNHHTVQVARVQVQYLRQWVDEKAPPAQVAEGEPPGVQVDYLR